MIACGRGVFKSAVHPDRPAEPGVGKHDHTTVVLGNERDLRREALTCRIPAPDC